MIPEDQASEAPPSGNVTILLVEDEPMIRSMCSRVLADNGYNALEASNGEEALRLTESHPVGMIDLLVTDVVMPRMGGIELARCLRESRPENKNLDNVGLYRGKSDNRRPFQRQPALSAEALHAIGPIAEGSRGVELKRTRSTRHV